MAHPAKNIKQQPKYTNFGLIMVINWENQQMNPQQLIKKALFSHASFSPSSTDGETGID
jgi:hypothetical protein